MCRFKNAWMYQCLDEQMYECVYVWTYDCMTL